MNIPRTNGVSTAAVKESKISKSTNPCTIGQVLHFTLNRQGLIERKLAITSDMFPLHATLHTTPCVSLFARVKDFKQLHMNNYLIQSQKSPLKYVLVRCMRGTLHMIPSTIYNTVNSLYNYVDNLTSIDRIKNFKIN